MQQMSSLTYLMQNKIIWVRVDLSSPSNLTPTKHVQAVEVNKIQ